MSIVDRLQIIAKERGTTFKQLERDVGLGNGTIRRWEEQSPRLDKLTKVANYLHVSLDFLVYGRSISEPSISSEFEIDLREEKERQGLTCDGLPLSEDEIDLIAMYRLLPPSHREELFDLVYFKYKRIVEQKKGSIYSTYFDKSGKGDPAESREARSGTA